MKKNKGCFNLRNFSDIFLSKLMKKYAGSPEDIDIIIEASNVPSIHVDKMYHFSNEGKERHSLYQIDVDFYCNLSKIKDSNGNDFNVDSSNEIVRYILSDDSFKTKALNYIIQNFDGEIKLTGEPGHAEDVNSILPKVKNKDIKTRAEIEVDFGSHKHYGEHNQDEDEIKIHFGVSIEYVG